MLAMKSIVMEAPDIGVDKALEKFGSSLSDSDKNAVKSLGFDELKSLKSAMSKLGSAILRADNINNNQGDGSAFIF